MEGRRAPLQRTSVLVYGVIVFVAVYCCLRNKETDLGAQQKGVEAHRGQQGSVAQRRVNSLERIVLVT